MGKRVCNETGCPVLIDGPGRCPQHQRDAETRRGSRQARGYDARHDATRKRWKPIVDAGLVNCWRCGGTLDPSSWHLGHDDHDRSKYRGPECPPCNLSAGGKAAHRIA